MVRNSVSLSNFNVYVFIEKILGIYFAGHSIELSYFDILLARRHCSLFLVPNLRAKFGSRPIDKEKRSGM